MDTARETLKLHSKGVGFTLEAYLSDFDAVVGHAKPARPVLSGYSHTAFFTTHYALAHAERLSALILFEPALFNEREELLHRAELALAGDYEGSLKAMFRKVQPEVAEDENVATVAARYIMKHVTDPRALGQELLVRANHPISAERLSTLTLPVLLVGGTKSQAAYTVHRAAACLPFAYVWWIEGATHADLVGDTYATKVSAAVSTFLSAVGIN